MKSPSPSPAAIAIAIAIAASGCSAKRSDGPDGAASGPPLAVATVTAQVSTEPESVSVSGVLEPARRVTLASRLPARIRTLRVREGDRVAANARLLDLDVRDMLAKRAQLRASRASAEAQLEWSDAELGRVRTLSEHGALPAATLDEMKRTHASSGAALAGVEAQLVELDVNLSDATLRAPFGGVVVRKLVEVGHFAAPSQPLLVLEDDATLRVSAAVSAPEAASLREGATVPIHAGGRVASGSVEAIVSSGVPSIPGARLIVAVDNPERTLRPGVVARIELPTTRESRDTVEVPTSALQHRGSLAGVWVVRGDRLAFAWVRIARSTASTTWISSGVSPGDPVVRAGDRPELRDGLQVAAAP